MSAVLALGVQLPVMTAYNYLLDKWAASGKVRRIDLSAKPPETILTSYAKSRYDQELREFYAKGYTDNDLDKHFFKGRDKKQYIEDLVSEARNNLFYSQRDRMRSLAQDGKPITTSVLRDANGKVLDWFHPTKLDELKELEFVKPDELSKARNDVYADVLKQFGIDPKDKKLFSIKRDWEATDTKDKYKRMKDGLEEVPENLKDYKKSAVKSALKKNNHTFKEFSTALEKEAEKLAISRVNAELKDEIAVKLKTSSVIDVMKKELMATREKIFNDASIPASDKVKTLSVAETQIVENQVNKFREQVKQSTNEEEVKILNRAINKMSGKKIKDIRFHGQTYDQVERSVKVKKWLRAEINRREGVFKNFKKLSGLVFGLAILPFTCGLLNWAYPRFMEKFFPELCDAKKQAKAAKEAK